MTKLRNYTYVLLLVLFGCAQLGLTQPKTFDERLAYAYGSHTAVLQTAAAAVNAKTMTSAEGDQVLKLADESRAVLDAARVAARAGDTAGANTKLVLAVAVLTQLQQYLQQRSK